MTTSKKLLIFVTEDWYFYSHRLPLAMAAKAAGFDVSVICRTNNYAEKIKKAGLNLIPLDIRRRGINPLKELKIIKRLIEIYKDQKPDIVHHVAIKPVLYGSIAAKITTVTHVVNALAGLGSLFSSQSLKRRFVRYFLLITYRLLLNQGGYRLILQNPDDVKVMRSKNIVSEERMSLIRGSGVDCDEFPIQPEQPGEVIVILASRMLWDKGIGVYVEAAKRLRGQGVSANFALVGDADKGNPSAISSTQLAAWQDEGVVEWWGRREDMPEVFKQAHIVCLPTFYGEGVPKVLLEAAASGRPIVTTDSPGCREIVRDGINGYLVPVRDAEALANALKLLIDSAELRHRMGLQGRNIAVEEFSVNKVNTETLHLYEELLT